VTTALVIEHIVEEGAGAFADWLPAAGLDLATHRVWRDGPPPRTLPGEYAALVVMGGSMGVGDAAEHPWIDDELALLASATANQTPVLGVCLGAQLLAAATGGTVTKGGVGPELGVRRLHLTDQAQADPLLYDLPPITEAVQWHWDEVLALPPGATLLAGSPAYPHQAFRVGDSAWGLQFHPEARPSMVRRWSEQDADAVRAAGEDPEALAAGAERAWAESVRTWAPVARRFAAIVLGTGSAGQDAAAATSKIPEVPARGL
jgi:GMP synthase-like glutamine amidotransferase